ncbi:epidermal growth factor receptor substrate 15-like 1 isoform X3 [Nilaparvata lugens]|uniref:epidermal growth factor receptor substrate 15-like 1 isoform X3 n=1 Tax=Nilaparvata lugens TaxID=108931 RepID=UPI00193E81F4|nr:epidermal growth factor receptor substrate 15-like 1 isoform X3 [Nilaparvata lugens]
MATLPSPTQVAGSQYSLYEAFYQQVDPTNHGSVGALEAAKFLKKSGLSDDELSKIWDLSDPNGKGYLNKPGFFVALKLVSLAQAGREVNILNTLLDIPPPKMGDTMPPLMKEHKSIGPPPPPAAVSAASDWAMKPSERANYDQLFDSLQPINGYIPGNKVKGLLIDSKLPVDTLGKIWDLADMDKDGSLDRHEFIVAMHLVYKALEKYAIPNVLPPELMPPGKRKDSIASGPVIPVTPVPVAPIGVPLMQPAEPPKPVPIPIPQITWVVSPEERTRYETLFIQSDVDKDGFVSGMEIKDVFLQSGVSQAILARIWGLCDMKQTGKLNCEQFCLAMWLINQKLKGIDPPDALTPEMIPPSSRSKPDSHSEPSNSPYSNPELALINKDIEELVLEKQVIENEILQKEADIKIKTGEVKSLQGELDTLAATLKQLENQKGEAQKRLNDLKNQRALVESELSDVKMEIDAEQAQVDNLRRQAEEQEASLKAQEAELNTKRQELEGLKQEETKLELNQNELKNRMESLSQNLQDSQLQISQVKAKITQVQEHQRQMNDVIALAENAIACGDASTVPDTCLNLQPEFRDPSFSRLINGRQESGDNSKDPFSSLNGPSDSGGDAFNHTDAFSNDPFKSTTNSTDPFASSDNFGSGFTSKNTGGFTSDPFSSFNNASAGKSDPFDPFGDGRGGGGGGPATANAGGGGAPAHSTPSQTTNDAVDPFGDDPFAALHAPQRPTSPSPALPPKKSKQRPPRPAPPKMAPTPSPTPTPDPFASAATGADSFADFSNFDSKFSDITGKEKEKATIPPRSAPAAAKSKSNANLDFTEDPFRDYRYEDPFNIGDPFQDATDNVSQTSVNNNRTSNNNTWDGPKMVDAFGMEVVSPPRPAAANGGRSPLPQPLPSEDQQLAWAAAESLRLEEERRNNQRKEIADLQMALTLSKKDKSKNRTTNALKRILS